MISIYVLNLSEKGAQKIDIAPFDFGEVRTIEHPNCLPSTGDAIVYVVGHAVPNGLKIGNENRTLPEKELAEELGNARQNARTLVIIDACFAQTFEDLVRPVWKTNFGLISSCQAYERSWHDGGHSRQSLFSKAFNHAMRAAIADGSCAALSRELKNFLGEVQTPSITEQAYEVLERAFGLKRESQPPVPRSQQPSRASTDVGPESGIT